MTYAFIKYWVEGTKEAAYQLYEAIANGEGWAKNSLENLGIDTEEYDTARAEWCNPTIEDRDGYSVVYFEEYYPYERGQLIDQLMEEEIFEDKLTQFCYYAEERDSDLFETNDGAGKYWPYRICVVSDLFEEDDLYCRNEAEAVKLLHEQYGIPEEYKDLEAIKSYVEEQPDVEFSCYEIEIVMASRFNFSTMTITEYGTEIPEDE